jgi:hypothetical protein
MKYEDIVQMAVTMTEMDNGVSLDPAERQAMVNRILGKIEKKLGV